MQVAAMMGQVARLQGTTDYVVYAVAAIATVIFWIVWIVVHRRKPAPSEAEAAAIAAKGPSARARIKSLQKVAIPCGLVGFVLVLTQLGDLKHPSGIFYIGIALALVAGVLNFLADAVYLKNWKSFRKRDRVG